MNKLKTLLLIGLCVLAGIAICLALGYFLPDSIFGGFYSTAAGYVGNFDASAVISNPATLLTAAVPAITVGTAALSQISKAKAEATQIKDQAQAQISSLSESASTATASLESATTKLSSTEATLASTQKELEQLKASTANVTQLQNELKSKTDQMDQLQRMYDAKINDIAGNAQVLMDPVTKQYYQASIIKPLHVP